jgi:hypothetical protein
VTEPVGGAGFEHSGRLGRDAAAELPDDPLALELVDVAVDRHLADIAQRGQVPDRGRSPVEQMLQDRALTLVRTHATVIQGPPLLPVALAGLHDTPNPGVDDRQYFTSTV